MSSGTTDDQPGTRTIIATTPISERDTGERASWRERWLWRLGEPLSDGALRSKRMGVAFLALILSATFWFELTPVNGIVLCPIRAVTGVECAGCGMTRSWIALVHGHWHAAVDFNPFGPILFGLAVAKLGTLGVEIGQRKPLRLPIWERVRVPVMGTLAAAMMLFGAWRIYLYFSV